LKIAGKHKEFSTKKANYAEARKVRQEALQAQAEGRLPTDFAKLAFEKAAEQWRPGREHTVSPKTRRIDKQRMVEGRGVPTLVEDGKVVQVGWQCRGCALGSDRKLPE